MVDAPRVSVIVANFNGARYIEAALASVLSQTLREIEVLVVDDCSTDDSVARVAAVAARDGRVRMLSTEVNGGPAAARNVALEAAGGTWLAVMDADDLMHPDRLARLVAAAERDEADIAADNLLVFDDDDAAPPYAALGPALSAGWIDAVTYVESNRLFARGPAIGYLKPVIRAATVHRLGLRYLPTLRIAEDYDFIARVITQGARFRVYPDLTYFYRKHAASISHRLSERTLLPMLAADDVFRTALDVTDAALIRALDQRRASIVKALDYDRMCVALKQHDWRAAARLAVHRPAVLPMLSMPVLARVRRLFRRPRKPDPVRKQVCVVSRQRLVGGVNGSSAYLLGLCGALRDGGFDVHLVCPSPAVFGRWPVLWMGPEMRVFRSIRIRGGWRIGRAFVARDPHVGFLATLTILDRLLRRLGLSSGRRVPNAPYSVAVPWVPEDFLFVARHARRNADLLLADYAFLTEAIPYCLHVEMVSAVVMHDLFSSRAAQFSRIGTADSVASLDEERELALLARADVVIAIQAEEAEFVRSRLPGKRVIVAPMAVVPVAAPQPGEDGSILFVGSNTAPNVQGLRWFIDAVWPQVKRSVPDADLTVAGSVAAAFAGERYERVQFLGRITDLTPIYQRAAVVISPLLVGSGLKIKLVEALGHGKASVVTHVSLQGVEALVEEAVLSADEPEAFGRAIVGLLRDRPRRVQLGQAALDRARQSFSSQECYRDVVALAVDGTRSRSSPR